MTSPEGESEFLERVSPKFGDAIFLIAPPKLTPPERLCRRLAFRNQLHVYSVKSAFSGKDIVSMFPPDSPFPVVSSKEWFADSWSGLEYGRAPDFSRSFLEQFLDLRNVVPHMARSALFNENSEFSNNLSYCKNCYFVFNTTHAVDCLYGENVWRSNDCIDCTHVAESELCYDCIMCERCYALQSSRECEGCSDSYYLLGCRGCRCCFGCVNLRRREYCIYNEQVSQEDYELFISQIDFTSRNVRAEILRKAEALWKQHPRPHITVEHCEDCSGNFLFHSKNVVDGYFVRDAESTVYSSFLYGGAKDCRDFTFVGLNAELMYECAWSGFHCLLCRFCWWCLQSEDLLYCWHCVRCRHCFGCAGLENGEYCIFNKKYSREEYELLVPRLIEHMRQTGEWGEFFPMSISPIPYNHSMAQRFYPVDAEEAVQRNLHWFDRPIIHAANAVNADELPDGLPATDAPLVVKGRSTNTAFLITSEEIRRYRKQNLPLPTDTYYERLNTKALHIGGVILYPRKCAATGRELMSIYPEESGWIVWDKEVYESRLNC